MKFFQEKAPITSINEANPFKYHLMNKNCELYYPE